MSNDFEVGSYKTGSFGGTTTKKHEYFKLKENSSNLFSILPPVGSLAKTQRLFAYYSTYFLMGTNGKKRPVVSIQRMNSNREILQRCPLHDKVESLLAKAKADREKLKLNPKDPSVRVAELEAIELLLKDLRPDKGYYFNAMTPSGSIGVLKLRKTAKQALEARFKELELSGVNPINDGIIFDIKKNKIDGKVTYTVDIAQKTVKSPDGKMLREYMTNPVDETLVNRLKNGEAADLGKLYKNLTEQELTLLATLDPKAVDTVFAAPERGASSDSSDFSDDIDDETSEPVSAANVAFSGENAAASFQMHTPVNTTASTTSQKASEQKSTTAVDDIVSQFLRNG